MNDDSGSGDAPPERPDFEPPRSQSPGSGQVPGAGSFGPPPRYGGWNPPSGSATPPPRQPPPRQSSYPTPPRAHARSQHWFNQPAQGGWARTHSSMPVTYTIIAICVVVWLCQLVVPGFNRDVILTTWSWQSQPWRLITSAFAHSVSGFMHIAGNMLMLWLLGRAIEPAIGRRDYVLSYLLSALGGSALFILFAALSGTHSAVVGASAAVFGLFGLLVGLYKLAGIRNTGIWVLLGINLVFDLIVPGIAWQGHLGGFLIGLGAGFLIAHARRRGRTTTPTLWLLLVPIVAALGASLALTG
ncbi:rhomboid family intramembrane serine protease [Propionibacterium freudenreichii]|uniref:rhomboid family intramembrane serine protease n=1 Tax=Propionibacterium freudenreichii TaxID=1744 RepID=UPI00254BCDBF|nr:rhomboid family intramembrane serine protease [Propionibacterium freudenreichii]MDK9663997.1 rhomboid family intramembrane serine protease [Propionibacterium freudenreichii]